MGLNAASDYFNRATDRPVYDLEWLLKIIDEMLVAGRTKQEAFARTRVVLHRCREAGIMISLKKLQGRDSVIFAGFVIQGRGQARPGEVSSHP